MRCWFTWLVVLAIAGCSATAGDSNELADVGASGDGTVVDASLQQDSAAPGDSVDLSYPDMSGADHPEPADLAVEAAADDVWEAWTDPDLPYPHEALEQPCPQADDAEDPAIKGIVYFDGDQTSDSHYAQGCFPPFDHPSQAVVTTLIGEHDVWQTETCANGKFGFGDLKAGTYALDFELPEGAHCTSSNCGRRFPEAVKEGKVVIVTIGDSIPNVGPSPRFPDRLAKMVGRLAQTENRNIAVSGSTAKHWLPGTSYFESKLLPELGDADVVLISLGGNDIMAYLGGAMYDHSKLIEKFMGLDEFQVTLGENVRSIVEEIMFRAPHVDIVFLLYFNYANATYWKGLAGSYYGMMQNVATNAFLIALEKMSAVPGLIIADMFNSIGDQWVDDYLSDSVHLSGMGHKVYAEQIFLSLGGALIGETTVGLDRQVGYWVEEP